jgi:DNA-binding transcriptional LysR family regulator
MNLRHLAVFYGVAKAGSVNAAAQQLHTSQPAISRELRTLEERLGMPLFDRLPRGMSLTEAGRTLAGYAERIFSLEQAAERAMRELADLEGGELPIGASATLGTYLLPPFVAAFHTRYRKVNLALDVGNTHEIVKGVLDARFVIGFVEGRVEDEALETREFRRDRIMAVVSPGYPLAKSGIPSLQTLAAADSILREPGSGTREIVERAFARHRLRLSCKLQIASAEAMKRAAAEGCGVAWISELCVIDELRSGRLVALHTSRLSLERPLYSLKLRGRHLNRSAATFLQEFQSALSSPGLKTTTS